MFYVTNYSFALALCVICMLCWGSWGNTQKLVDRHWRYECFYWDFVIGLLLLSVAMGVTLGACVVGSDWGFFRNLRSSFGYVWCWPFLAGVVFNLANILFSASIAEAGMAVAFPIGSGLAGVGGTLLNYLLMPTGRSLSTIVTGLTFIVASIVCSAFAFRIREMRTMVIKRKSSVKVGLCLASAAGILMMWFSPLVNKSVDMTFAAESPALGLMTPYSAFFIFTFGVFVSNFVWNGIAMRHPVSGDPIAGKEFFRGALSTHLVGCIGGAIWGLGSLMSFVSAGAISPAISYGLGQGATLVSAAWGMLVWKEFNGSPPIAHWLNGMMIVLFLVGLVILAKVGM